MEEAIFPRVQSDSTVKIKLIKGFLVQSSYSINTMHHSLIRTLHPELNIEKHNLEAMQRLYSFKNMCHHIFLNHQTLIRAAKDHTFDVFLSHRGIDTKRNVALLLYDHLRGLGIRPFLDCKNLKPGDKLFENIDTAVLQSRVGIAVFSPHYCNSYYCLHELSLMVESNKKIIPIYCDVKPVELKAKDQRISCPRDLERFTRALEHAKDRVGITFDTSTGNWSEFLANVSDAVKNNLLEVVKVPADSETK